MYKLEMRQVMRQDRRERVQCTACHGSGAVMYADGVLSQPVAEECPVCFGRGYYFREEGESDECV